MRTDTQKPTELALVQGMAQGMGVANWSGADTDARLVELWIQSKRSAGTRRKYAEAAQRFLDAMGKPLAAVTLSDLLAYGKTLQAAGLKTSTQVWHQMAVKSLLGFAARTGYLRYDVGRAWHTEKAPDTLSQRILTESEVLALIAAAKRPRDRALLRLLYHTGLRVSEVAALTWEHVRRTEDGGAVLSVYGKGGKTRFVSIDAELLAELVAISPAQRGPIFVSQKRSPLSARRIDGIVSALGRKVLGKAVSPHWIRHCTATHALRRGMPISDVAAHLGHGSIAVTSRYLHANPTTRFADYLPR